MFEQSRRLPTSLPTTAHRFHASVNAEFQALVSPSANCFHFWLVCFVLATDSSSSLFRVTYLSAVGKALVAL
jgi:hypothetical protein